MTTIKKITKKETVKPIEVKKIDEVKEPILEVRRESRTKCLFCKSKNNPVYTDVATLKKFINDRSRINPKAKSGVCSKHQRFLTKHIKYARHLALLPFTPSL
jgi:small subunit ribosomal protein S18